MKNTVTKPQIDELLEKSEIKVETVQNSFTKERNSNENLYRS